MFDYFFVLNSVTKYPQSSNFLKDDAAFHSKKSPNMIEKHQNVHFLALNVRSNFCNPEGSLLKKE